jgi:hypothetical protein
MTLGFGLVKNPNLQRKEQGLKGFCLITKNKGQMTNLILVVEDNDLMRSHLCEQLIEAGYEVVEAR